MTCLCTVDPLDHMPLVNAACSVHGRGPITEAERLQAGWLTCGQSHPEYDIYCGPGPQHPHDQFTK